MKLELKHLAPYLPYRLKVKDAHNGKIHTITTGETLDYVFFYCSTNKPHLAFLRPLSDLTKEIEVNGKKFIPIMVIYGGENYREYDFTIDVVENPILGKRIEISVIGIGSPCFIFGLKNPAYNLLTFDNWQLLYEWHFDIYNLIENGLAIDINTLNK